MINLTQEQVVELLETQRKFDDRIETKNLEDTSAAFIIEFVEWVNTVEFFKNWKQNKGKDKGIQLEELADMLAFGLSLINQVKEVSEHSDEEISRHVVEISKERDLMKLELNSVAFLKILHSFTGVFNDPIGMEEMCSLTYMAFVFANTYYTVDELIEAYKNKMEINHGRQDSGY
ncbi:dUTP diphosphatase [Macrococcus brunensis]|uniref:dUTP diphosphatase n=1 Tax=Macrococcus brunensis TaxID=198483 RepID=UPI001EF10EA6|nr:dUTP diphosphatase [Macrococcus brunensis]ULG73010.1 dUTP diphosphatase [Macrococcus brunensis]